jgi:hypothetical protein
VCGHLFCDRCVSGVCCLVCFGLSFRQL